MWRQLMKATEGISLCRKLSKGYKTMHNSWRICTEANKEERSSMQVWLQRTVGCIALSSLVFLVQISGGCGWVGVGGFVGVCNGGWHWCEGVCLCYVQGWARSSSTQNCVEATWNNLELAIFTRRRISLCLSRAIGSLIKIML